MKLAPLEPHFVGPTWEKTEDGEWHLPEFTLGWGIINWWFEYLNSPSGDDNGEGFMPTLEQARFILWWYAVDKNGQFVYRNGTLRRLKGWGKDPLAAALAMVELSGPVAFSHFDDGMAVGKPKHAAWIQIVAVAQEQTKNTFSLFPVMITKKLKETYGLEVNKTIIYAPEKGGRIESVTSSPYTMEGARPSLVICNETQWWVESNDGHEMMGVIEGNITKIAGSRRLSICNAHIPGDESVAEVDYDAWQSTSQGLSVDVGVLYDALEAPADTPLGEIPSQKTDPDGYEEGLKLLKEGLLVARGDSTWLPIDAIIESVLDVRNPVTESRRKFLNQVNAAEDSWISPAEWDALAMTDPLFRLKDGEKITLGFDGSKSNDWSALVACRVHDGMIFPIKWWEPKRYPSGEVPREEIDSTVRSTLIKYDVVAFRADVREFEAYVDNWSKEFGKKMHVKASPNNPIAFDMRGQQKRFALDCERFLDAVLEREVNHDGNKALRQSILNAKRNPTNYDAISIRKASKDSQRKIDIAVCAVLAFGARYDLLMSKKGSRTGKAVIIR